MGFGMVLGGAAQGLQAGAGIAQKNRSLNLQEMELGQNKDYQNRTIDIREKELKNAQWQQMTTEAEKQIAAYTAAISELIPKALAAGQTPEKIMGSIEPVLGDIDKLSQGIGKDSSAVRNQIKAQLSVPAQQELKIGQTKEAIYADIAAGKKLTPGQERFLEIDKKQSANALVEFAKALGMDMPETAPASGTPGPTPTPVPTTTTPAASAADVEKPLPFEREVTKRIPNRKYELPNGKVGIWTKDPDTGATGWILI